MDPNNSVIKRLWCIYVQHIGSQAHKLLYLVHDLVSHAQETVFDLITALCP